LSTLVSWQYLILDQDCCLPHCFQFLILSLWYHPVSRHCSKNYRQPLSMDCKCRMRGRYFGRTLQPVVPTERRGVAVTALYHDRELNCRRVIQIIFSFSPRCLQRIPEQFTKIGYGHFYVLPNCKRVI